MGGIETLSSVAYQGVVHCSARNASFKSVGAGAFDMTIVALLAEPPQDGSVLPALTDSPVLSETEARELYSAMLADTLRAVRASGGELLVNYAAPGKETDAEAAASGDEDAEAQLRAIAADTLGDLDGIRFEPQVGSTPAAVIGNTVTHLLEREEATTAAVLRPEAPFVDRSLIDSAAMKLRRNDVVLGPAADGRVYYAGFSEPVDFEDALEPPAVETLATRGVDAGLSVEFETQQPLVDTGEELRTFLSLLQARRRSGVAVPASTAELIEDLGLAVECGEEGLELVRH